MSWLKYSICVTYPEGPRVITDYEWFPSIDAMLLRKSRYQNIYLYFWIRDLSIPYKNTVNNKKVSQVRKPPKNWLKGRLEELYAKQKEGKDEIAEISALLLKPYPRKKYAKKKKKVISKRR
tara:strand:- start:225 stop:587 length:363 start_codon:yes stop_codon:yes gene_type:complete